MSFASFKQAPAMRPQFNIGFPYDIMTGRYYTGKHGEQILSGGLNYLTGFGGRGNLFKTTVAHHANLTMLNNYLSSQSMFYETEISGARARVNELAVGKENIGGTDLFESGRMYMTDASEYSGTEWFNQMKGVANQRAKDKKDWMDTPFVDKEGNAIGAYVPWSVLVDSLSKFRADVVNNLVEKGGVGDSERNVEALRDAASKTQFLNELPVLAARTGTYFILTAHVGDKLQLDPYAPQAKKLEFLKNNTTFKYVPEAFTFLMNDCWLMLSAAPLINQTTKAPEFPRSSDDGMKGDTDLVLIRMMNLRSKSGPSGLPIEIIASQSEGVKVGLSEFHYIRTYDRFGIDGNLQNYFLDLYPDCKLSRTTIRKKLDTDRRLQRAMSITAEICQMKNMWHDVPDGWLCTPKALYDDLKAMGYDWDVLLDTRGYWTFKDDEANHKHPFLSTADLLNMRLGVYIPYWLKDFTPKSLSKEA